ncbi:hypothetical protein [Herbaspirillum chlorophenolicum]|uniref:hypothetical protein n=1 Tax=Herbaspirillum chlorophenolicum TaxID=211589 RepID=UPI000B0F68C0|nr:hypothetical protein [Herbaspirillum chlorophenolicum]
MADIAASALSLAGSIAWLASLRGKFPAKFQRFIYAMPRVARLFAGNGVSLREIKIFRARIHGVSGWKGTFK